MDATGAASLQYGRYLANARGFDCVANLDDLIAAGGFVDLPALAEVPDGAIYAARLSTALNPGELRTVHAPDDQFTYRGPGGALFCFGIEAHLLGASETPGVEPGYQPELRGCWCRLVESAHFRFLSRLARPRLKPGQEQGGWNF